VIEVLALIAFLIVFAVPAVLLILLVLALYHQATHDLGPDAAGEPHNGQSNNPEKPDV
jgi:hypothetical protein